MIICIFTLIYNYYMFSFEIVTTHFLLLLFLNHITLKRALVNWSWIYIQDRQKSTKCLNFPCPYLATLLLRCTLLYVYSQVNIYYSNWSKYTSLVTPTIISKVNKTNWVNYILATNSTPWILSLSMSFSHTYNIRLKSRSVKTHTVVWMFRTCENWRHTPWSNRTI